MKKRLQGLIAGILAGTLLTGGVVFAKEVTETAELFYNNIKIFIDGGEIVPKDAVGNTVEPFIMNGTTYLPVRAISNAFGKDVEWDGTTQSVYIGKKDQTKPDNYLDKIQYNDYKEASRYYWMNIINGTAEDYNKNVYTNGLMFFLRNDGAVADDPDDVDVVVSYPLNSQYSNLKGKIVLPKKYQMTTGNEDNCRSADVDVLFYGDDELLYKATNVTASMPFSFDIDTRGVNQLSVKLRAADLSHVALTDLALYK